MTTKEIIQERKSVRTFITNPLTDEDDQKLADFLEKVDNPFGVPIEFRFLNAEAHKLANWTIVGPKRYIAAKGKLEPHFETAYGYVYESLCLYASSLGIGSVLLGCLPRRKKFEAAMELQPDEVMPLVSPVGYAAEKRSIREKIIRLCLGSDKRKKPEKILFENNFSTPLTEEGAGKFKDALDMMCLAPSAMNNQPWLAVVCGSTVHFFKKGKPVKDGKVDYKKVSIGAALSHFVATLKEDGINGRFVVQNPKIETKSTQEYVISYEI